MSCLELSTLNSKQDQILDQIGSTMHFLLKSNQRFVIPTTVMVLLHWGGGASCLACWQCGLKGSQLDKIVDYPTPIPNRLQCSFSALC